MKSNPSKLANMGILFNKFIKEVTLIDNTSTKITDYDLLVNKLSECNDKILRFNDTSVFDVNVKYNCGIISIDHDKIDQSNKKIIKLMVILTTVIKDLMKNNISSHYRSLMKYPIDVIMPLLNESSENENIKNHTLDGYKFNTNSIRLMTFLKKGTSCVSCGLSASYFSFGST